METLSVRDLYRARYTSTASSTVGRHLMLTTSITNIEMETYWVTILLTSIPSIRPVAKLI